MTRNHISRDQLSRNRNCVSRRREPRNVSPGRFPLPRGPDARLMTPCRLRLPSPRTVVWESGEAIYFSAATTSFFNERTSTSHDLSVMADHQHAAYVPQYIARSESSARS
jgi:hypothetical protein